MTMKQMELQFNELGFWVIEIEAGYKLQNRENGSYIEAEYNIEMLEATLEDMQRELEI